MRDYKYYINPYKKYNEDLKDWDKNSVKGLKETVNDLVDKSSKFINIFSLWCGSVAEETKASLESQIEGMSKLRDNVNNNLSGAVDQLDLLKTDASSLKTEEDDLIVKEEELQNVENNRVNKPDDSTTDEDAEKNYQYWKLKRDRLKRSVSGKESNCRTLQSVCDTHISSIDEYNGSVDELSESFSTLLEEAFGIEDFDSLPPEEKARRFQEVIDKMIEDYKAIQENLSQPMNVPQDFYQLCFIFEALGTGYSDVNFYSTESHSAHFNPEGIKEIVKYSEDQKLWDKLNAYLSGKSWEESGLSAFPTSEEDFLNNLGYGFDGDMTKEELMSHKKQFDGYFKLMKTSVDMYDENIQKLGLLNTSIYAARQIQNTIQYEGISNSPGFAYYSNIIPSENNFLDWLDWQSSYKSFGWLGLDAAVTNYLKHKYPPKSGLFDGHELEVVLDNLNKDEQKVYAYLYKTSGEDYATQYLKDMADTINRRVGLRRANEFVEWVANNDNPDFKAWEDIADRTKMFGKGFQNGLVSFTDGIHDLWDPSVVKEFYEYEDAAIIALMQSEEIRQKLGDDKVNKLLTWYGWGDVVGENSIPVILNFVHPGLGDAAQILNTTGSTLEDDMRENAMLLPEEQHSMVAMYAHAGVKGGAKSVVNYAYNKLNLNPQSKAARVGCSFAKDATTAALPELAGCVFLGDEFNSGKVLGKGFSAVTGFYVDDYAKALDGHYKYLVNLFKGLGKEATENTVNSVYNARAEGMLNRDKSIASAGGVAIKETMKYGPKVFGFGKEKK